MINLIIQECLLLSFGCFVTAFYLSEYKRMLRMEDKNQKLVRGTVR